MTNCPFPVGFGGFFQTDPNTIYSGTTWAQKKDVFILAAGDTYPAGSTGGEAEHVLTESELPAVSAPLKFSSGDPITVSCDGKGSRVLNVTAWEWNQNTTANASVSFGSSQPHNNMPPYFAMPFWIRTA